MKRLIALLCLWLLSHLPVSAQHTLIGTWEMVSIKGINAQGERFANNTSTTREIKVITPTHYMLIAYDVEGDSLVFNRCYVGKVEIRGNTYNEIPMLSSVTIFENVKTDYTWKVSGDKFIQSGTLIRPDGKKVILEELIFQQVKSKDTYPHNPIIGAWRLLSSKYVTPDGAKHADTDLTVDGLYIFTPTHWMYASAKDKKFEHAMMGTYSMDGDKFYPNLDHASFPKNLWGQTEMTQRLQEGKLYVNGVSVFPDGRKFTWEDVYERAK